MYNAGAQPYFEQFDPESDLEEEDPAEMHDLRMLQDVSECYLRTNSESRPGQQTPERSFTKTSDSLHYEYTFTMSAPNEPQKESCAAASVQSDENRKESGKKSAACQVLKNQVKLTATNQAGNEENRAIDTDIEDEEFRTLSVGDGHYLVDLGSSSELIVDEECILQLFKSCRECNRQCTVRKRVKGLKLAVYQTCSFCQNRYKWTNLTDDEEDDFHINGKDAPNGQTDSGVSPGSITS